VIIIGITGRSGSGKSTALKIFEKYGAVTIDADKLYHDMLLENSDMVYEIKNRFALGDGEIDTKKLGKIVFNDKNALDDLNEITFKYICKEINDVIKTAEVTGTHMVVIDAIAIIESGIGNICDYKIAVVSDDNIAVNRLVKRDNIDKEYAQLRLSGQKNQEFYIEKCDYVVRNNGDERELSKACEDIYNRIINRKKDIK